MLGVWIRNGLVFRASENGSGCVVLSWEAAILSTRCVMVSKNRFWRGCKDTIGPASKQGRQNFVLLANAASMHLMRVEAMARVLEQLVQMVHFGLQPVESSRGPDPGIRPRIPEGTLDAVTEQLVDAMILVIHECLLVVMIYAWILRLSRIVE